MKWIIFTAFLGCIGWYFADQNLPQFHLAIIGSDHQYHFIAQGWHILQKMWPALAMTSISAGISFACFIFFFISSEKADKETSEHKLKEFFNERENKLKSFFEHRENENDKHYERLHERELELHYARLAIDDLKKQYKQKCDELISKINHQHATIKRLKTKRRP